MKGPKWKRNITRGCLQKEAVDSGFDGSNAGYLFLIPQKKRSQRSIYGKTDLENLEICCILFQQ